MKTNEISERAFDLTKDAALLNPANYTVWYYRRLLLKALNKDLKEELNFITEVIKDNPKNYQVWQHRRCIVDYLKDPCKEIEFISSILHQDSKNYHAWQYRQYIIKIYDLWNGELEYTENLINLDIRNNSAWNMRFFYINHTQDISIPNIFEQEINYCIEKIIKCIDNESVWNYIKALIRNKNEFPKHLVDFCIELYTSTKDDEKSPFLCSFLCDYYEHEIEKLIKYIDSTELNQNLINDVKIQINNKYKISIEILKLLASKFDVMREKYWLYIINKWQIKYDPYL